MSSPIKTTQITRVECSEDEDNQKADNLFGEISFEGQSSSDSDSDYLEDSRYDTTPPNTEICEEALQKLKDLFLRKNFNKLEVIQQKSDKKESNGQLVSHVILTDKKVNPLEVNDFFDENKKYLFKSKAKLLKQLKQKSEKKSKKSLELDPVIEIPKTFDEFKELIFDLKADLIFDSKSKLFFKEETHYRDIRFKSHDSYLNSFIPFVIRELWNHLKKSAKSDLNSYQMSYHKNESSNDIVLTHIRHNSCTQSVFKFGQIVVIKYAVNQKEDSEAVPEMQSLFGFIIGVEAELIDKSSDYMSDPLLLSQTNNEEIHYILEKITIVCKQLDQTFDSVSVTPLTCVQKYLIEARVVYESKTGQDFDQIFQQILKPRFKSGVFGFSVNLEERKDLFDFQRDGIQKAYEICVIPELSNEFSSFVAIYGGPKSGKTEILMETALQLFKCADHKVINNKLIIVANGTDHFREIIDTLKKNEISVFHIDSEGKCLSHKNSDFRRLIKKMKRENQFDDIPQIQNSFEECLKYFSDELDSTDLLVSDQYVKEVIYAKVVHRLISLSNVIIGSISSIMNCEPINTIYNMNPNNNIDCALIDEAHLLTETELLTLLYCGIKRFALFGDISQNPISYEKSESFLKRYIGVFNKNFHKTDPKLCSVLYLRETIESYKKYLERQNNPFNNRQNNGYGRGNGRGGRKSSRQAIAEYISTSNYGSEYFNRSDRFKDYKPFKAENNDGFKSNTYFKAEHKNERQQTYQTRPHNPNQSTSQVSHNPMIDGIRPQFGFGGRGGGRPQTNYNYNSYRFPPNHNRNGVSNGNNDPNTNYSSNGSTFVSNPTRHQNNNLF